MINLKKFLFISTILFVVFSFSLISLNFNELPIVSKVYSVSNQTQQQLDQTASILSSIQSIINKLKTDIQLLFGREVKAATETIGLVRQDCAGYSNCFTSLSAWEAAYGGITFGACAVGDLVCADKIAIAQIDGAWTNPDTTAVTINGWTTDATHYIKIYTTTAARHNGKWDTGKYRLERTASGNTYALIINEDYVNIDGLQINILGTSDLQKIGILVQNTAGSALSEIKISNNIIKNEASGTGSESGINVQTGKVKIWNNIVYDQSSRGIYGNTWNNANLYVYNNTMYANGTNIVQANGATLYLKNNIANSPITLDYSGAFDAAYSNNISQDNTSPNVSLRSKIVLFVDSTNKDFHLSSSDTSAKDAGTNLSVDANLAFSDDIDGNTRPVGTAWDIGADEESTVAPPSDTTPPVLSSGSPTGALPSGTTQTTLSVSTNNENATCKYGITANTAYASIANTFTTTGGISHSQTITGLTNGTSYNYYVRCSDASGNANTTDYTISFSVASPPPPAGDTTPPTVSITSPINGTTVSGIITISANATDNVAVAGVQFKLDTTTNLGAEDTISPYSYSLNTTTITDGSHTLIAVARDTSNNYATSSIITITVNNTSPPPPDITAPSIPTGLTATTISSSQINLSWIASTDNVGVTGYKIYRCAGLTCAPTVQIATSVINSYSNTGLTASTAYTYAVSAYDAAGNESGKSANASATTQAQTGNTYYISPIGSDTVGNGSSANPWATLSKAFSQMVGGDTLVVRDGIYTGELNSIDNIGFNRPTVIPPNGNAANYTVIRAENEGQVTFDGEGARPMFNLTAPNRPAQYLEFRGMKWINTGGNPVVFISSADHIKMLRVGAGDSKSISSSARSFYITKSSYILLEDAYAWGAGRYKFQFFVSDHIICRRCVARTDATEGFSGATPSIIAIFQNYCSQYVEFQNSIAIDTDTPQYWTQWYELEGAFTSHPYCATFNEYSENTVHRGSIALNNRINGSGVFVNSSRNFSFIDFVGWDTGRGLWGQTPSAPYNYIIDHSLFGNMKGSTKSHGVYDSSTIGSTVVRNSILYDNAVNGLRGVASSNYNSFYANTTDYLNVSPGLNDLSAANGSAINPITGTPGNGVPSLKYLTRIENSSDLDGKAGDGGDIGPTILKKIGFSGTLYGEPGYNEVTNEDLWPFPYEDQIKSAFASYNPGGADPTKPNGKRGFTADGTGLYGGPITLTSYIWEYLGNSCPAGVCVAIPDTTAPSTPTNFTATAVSSSQINLSWTASADNVGVTGYKIYRCTGSTCAPTTQIATSLTTSYSNTGLTASTAYTYAVSAYDAAGNESAKSSAISATTLTTTPQDTTLPTISLTSPTNGATVSGIITMAASASDNVAVAGVQFKLDGVNLGIEDITSPYSLSYDTTQTTNGSHTLLAIARDSSNNRATSSAITITVNNDLTAPVISNVATSTISTSTATISWTTNEPATSQVEYGLTTNYTASTTKDANLTTSHVVLLTNLSLNTTYNFRVLSEDASNNKAFSVNYSFKTTGLPDTTPPSQTTDLKVQNVTQTSVDLVTWTAAGDDGNQGTAFQFDIRYTTGEFTENTWNDSSVVRAIGESTPKPAGSTMSYTLLGLTPNTTYKVALKTLDEVLNESLISNIITFTTLKAETTPSPTPTPAPGGGAGFVSDTTPPSSPSSLKTVSADKQIILSWKNPPDIDFARVIVVRKEGEKPISREDGIIIYEGTQQELTDINLDNDKTYYYAIYAYDKKPNYSTPTIIQAKPEAGRISIPIERTPEQTIPYPDGSLLKTEDNDKIYVIIDNKKRWITNPEVFISYGFTSHTQITVSPEILSQYQEEKEISTPSPKEGTLIRAKNDFKVYIIKPPFKRHIFNPAIFNMYQHFNWNSIKEIDQDTLDSYITSDLYRAINDPKVFSLEEINETEGIARKRWLDMTPEDFVLEGYDWNQVFVINPQERDYYQEGEAIKR